MKDKLLTAGLVAFEILPVLNSKVKLLTLTTQGRSELERQGVRVAVSGRAGLEHEFWRVRIKERCVNRGYRVTEKFSLGNGRGRSIMF